MDMIFKYLPVERGLIILFDEDGNPVPKLTKFIEGADAQDIPISRTILKMVAEQQVALMTSNALEDARLLGGKSIAIHGIRSAMCVPLWNRQRVIGAVQVDSPIHIGRFTEEDLDLLTALANFAAVAIERAQLSEKIEQERKIRSKMERYHSPAVIDEIVKGVDRRGRDRDPHRRRVDSLRRHLRLHDRLGDEEAGRSGGVPLALLLRARWSRSSRTAARSINSSATR